MSGFGQLGAGFGGLGFLRFGGGGVVTAPSPTFLSASRGININPPQGNWTAAQDGLSPNRSAALKFAGYDSLRIWGDFNKLTFPGGSNPNLATGVAQEIAHIQNALDDGWNVMIATSLAANDRLNVMNPGSAANTQFHAAWTAFATAVAANFPAHRVCLELMNEPPNESDISAAGYPAYASVFAPAVFQTIRAAAPNNTIAVGSSDLQWVGAIDALDPADYDDNTIFTFHGYDPGEFSHQGQAHLWKHLDNLPWPVTSYEGGITQAKADMAAKVNADGTLDAGQKSALITANNARLDFLFGGGGTKAYFTGHLNDIAAWCTTHSIDPKRVNASEFGVVSEHNWDGTPGTFLEARVAYERDWREEMEARGFNWMVYQALGDLEHFEQTSTVDQGERLIVELTEALGLTCPTPATISDLTVFDTGVSSITLAFSEVNDATSYEYRLNGGSAQALPTNKTITALDAETVYDVEVRGKNATTVGAWASVDATTDAAPTAPAWVQAYGSPTMVAEFDNDRYWVSNTESTTETDVAVVSRASSKYFDSVSGVFSAFSNNVLARTDKGLSIEPAMTGPSMTPAKIPASTFAASTSFPSGFQNFGGGAGFTMAGVDDATALANSGLTAIAPAGVVYEVVNTSGSTKYIQWQGGTINGVAQVGSWYARKISGTGNVALGKPGSGGTGRQNIATSATYSRYTFTDSGSTALEIAIPNGVTFRFILATLEYKAALPPSTPVLTQSRPKDAVSLTAAAQAAVNAASTIQIDTGSGLTATNAAALATLLDGSGVTLRKIVTFT